MQQWLLVEVVECAAHKPKENVYHKAGLSPDDAHGYTQYVAGTHTHIPRYTRRLRGRLDSVRRTQ